MISLIIVVIYFVLFALDLHIPAYIVGIYIFVTNMLIHLFFAKDKILKITISLPILIAFTMALENKLLGFCTGSATSAFFFSMINLFSEIKKRRNQNNLINNLPPDVVSILEGEPKGITADEDTRRMIGKLVEEIAELIAEYDENTDAGILEKIEDKKLVLRENLDPMTLNLLKETNPRIVE